MYFYYICLYFDLFLFWFSFCFRMVFVCNFMHIFIIWILFSNLFCLFKIIFFKSIFIFKFYFHIWTNAHIKKLQKISAILFLIWNHPQHFQKSYLLITAKHLIFIDFQTQIIDWIKIVYWFKRQIIYYF